MEALIELIAAFVVAIARTLIGVFEFLAALLAIVVEFIFVALTQGIAAASRQYRDRKQDRPQRLDNVEAEAQSPKVEPAPSNTLKRSLVWAAMACFICVVATRVIRDRIRKQRVAETRSQVEQLADTFAEQIKGDGEALAEPGRLRDLDAWQQPIELFVDNALLGSLVVVRSSGPDCESGSIDDILATRVVHASAKELGGELANRGIKMLRNGVAGLLPSRDKTLPADIDIDEQRVSEQEPESGPRSGSN